MQFIIDGPDIPDTLLQAHEEGRVVFFCGAGISVPAGLPNFEGLVNGLYEYIGEVPDGAEQQWLPKEADTEPQYDRAIGHFEDRIQGGRENVRRHLPKILSPTSIKKPGALTTHMALLTLARHKDALRLITTNVDTLFESAEKKYNLPRFTIHRKPPNETEWNGLVYLHGRMPEDATSDELDHLILSDQDFGKAYLLEAWAARFVANLFREYTVCFIGYSIGDPVLRYMTAAYTGRTDHMFAFAPFKSDSSDDKKKQEEIWNAKRVTPILYDDKSKHRLLHRTVQVWASLSRIQRKERLVRRIAGYNPDNSSPNNDYFINKMLWALSDPSGLPAKCFAEVNPVPSLKWLDVFAQTRFSHSDLNHFGVPPHDKPDDNKFCFIRRPGPYRLAQPMSLLLWTNDYTRFDAVMEQIARWLTRHLNDPELLLWITRGESRLHPRWAQLIEQKLGEIRQLEREGKTNELNEIQNNAPNAIPTLKMCALWRLMLAGRVQPDNTLSSMYTLQQSEQAGHNKLDNWSIRLALAGKATASLRLQLRELLAPKVVFQEQSPTLAGLADIFATSFPTNQQHAEISDPTEQIFCQLILASDFKTYLLKSQNHASLIQKWPDFWQRCLPDFLEDFQQLLLDAMGLLAELGRVEEHQDYSCIFRPSIGQHDQNEGHDHGWLFLIDLLRDAWLEVLQKNSARATRIALNWFDIPYPLFKRLALFAAAQDDCIEPRQWIEWLLADEARWLWSWHTRREVCRLFVAQGKKCEGPEANGKCPEAIGKCPEAIGKSPEASGKCPETIGECPEAVGKCPETIGERPEAVGKRPEADSSSAEQARLEAAILADPPVSIVCGDADLGKVPLDTQQAMVDRAVQLRLSRLRESGLALGAAARERLAALEAKRGRLADDESDEFLMWHSGITSETFGQPSEERRRRANLPPPEREKLLPWLREVARKEQNRQQGMDDSDEGSVWTQYCRRHAMQCGCALCDAAKENIWPSRPWQFAVLAWSEEQNTVWLGRRAWQYFAPLLLNEMPDKTLLEVAPNASSWLLSMAEFIDNPDELFLPLCQRILDLPFASKPASTGGDPVHEAINHPVGGVIWALGKFWYKIADPNQHDSLPDNVEALFRQICNVDKKQFRHGRVVLAMYLPALCKVARAWTKENLLPYFNWHNPEARAMWMGFLYNPWFPLLMLVDYVPARAMWMGFLYNPLPDPSLVADFKVDFLETAEHYKELGNLGFQFAQLLTDVALAQIDGYRTEEFRKAFAALPQPGLEAAADWLWRFREAAGDRQEEFWKNRIQPFWHKVWPKSKDRLSPEISQSLAELCLAAGDEFPAALETLRYWLQPLPFQNGFLNLVLFGFYSKNLGTVSMADGTTHPSEMKAGRHAELLSKFPEESLQFLDAIMPADAKDWCLSDREAFQQCLEDIVQAQPELRHDQRWQKLDENCRIVAR